MHRCFAFAVALMIVVSTAVSVGTAAEGMWLPDQLPGLATELTSLGLELDPAALADLTAAPLGAVIWLGGCTASFVSPQGLVVTNHHCGYGSIQFNSTPERNLIEDGFLAHSFAEELPAAPGSRIYVAEEATDVTAAIQASVPDEATGRARHDAVEAAEKRLVAACEAEPGTSCRIGELYGGLRYVLYRQLEIRDVRLVYAPARSIGNYGGDVDNWMWPRHTGDFTFLRAYVGPDGRPADPSPANVPYRPRHWLEVSAEGVRDGDFVMVAGYPGETDRYRLAHEVEDVIDWYYPTRRQALLELLDVIAETTAGRPAAAIAYAPMVSWFNNSTKNYAGMLKGFATSDVVERKRGLERNLQAWIEADPVRRARWGDAIADLDLLVEEDHRHEARDLELGLIGYNPMISSARKIYRLARERELPDAQRSPGFQQRDLPELRTTLQRIQRRFDPTVDRALLRHMLLRYARLPADQRLPVLDAWFGIGPEGAADAVLDATLGEMYRTTGLIDEKTRLDWLTADRAAVEASDDPFLRLAVALYDTDRRLESEQEDLDGRLLEARPRVMEALLAYRRGRGERTYPDANGTLRVTYGVVSGYEPRDGVFYEPFTTAYGILEKATGEPPFDPPAALAAAIEHGEWGRYDPLGPDSLPVDFLSTVDTTGGNSGSPTLDARGRLVGLLFDGNWESIVSDWDFLPEVTRSIHCDARYMLWVMDRVDGAWNLLREMGIEPRFEPKE